MHSFFVTALVFVLVQSSTSLAMAQLRVFEKGANNTFMNAQLLTDPVSTTYTYGYLGNGEDLVDYYAFEIQTVSPPLTIQLLTFEKAALDFRPTLVVVDPHESKMSGTVPFGFPENAGGQVYEWNTHSERKMYDEVMLESMVSGPTVTSSFKPGRYVLAVFNPQGTSGRYVLSVGHEKREASFLEKISEVIAFARIKLSLY